MMLKQHSPGADNRVLNRVRGICFCCRNKLSFYDPVRYRQELADHPEDYKNIDAVEVVHGHAETEILKAAERLNADVIIMGTHGKGAIAYTFLGSVAERVLHKSRRPVFVTPIPD